MRNKTLTTREQELVSAWIDGELSPDESRQVEALVRTEPNWRQLAEQYRSVDALLGRLSPPALTRDLTAGVQRRIRKAREKPSVGAWLAPLATAACIAAVAWLGFAWRVPRPSSPDNLAVEAQPAPGPVAGNGARTALVDLPEEDRFVVENLDLFTDYPVLLHFDTLRAMDELASKEDRL